MSATYPHAALQGLGAARARYESALGADEVADEVLFVPVAEGLWWATALDEHLQSTVAEYLDRRGSVIDGQIMAGIRYARNRTGHKLVAAFQHTTGVRLPLRIPFSIGGWKWLRTSELPSPDPRFADPRGAAAFDAYLSDELVAETLRRAEAWLTPWVAGALADSPRTGGEP